MMSVFSKKDDFADYKSAFKKNIHFENYQSLKYFIIFLFIWTAFLLYSDLLLIKISNNFPDYKNFLWLNISLIISFPIFFLVYIFNKPLIIKDVKNYHNFLTIFISVSIMILVGIIAGIKQSTLGGFPSYLICVFIFSVLFQFKAWTVISIYILSLAAFMITTLHYHHNPTIFFVQNISVLFFFILALLISRFQHIEKLKNYLIQKDFLEINQNLRTEVDERKIIELELQKMKDELEGRVNERTKELANTYYELVIKLNESRKNEEQVKASLREKNILLQEIYHRVNNNLQIILSMFKLQQYNIKSDEVRNVLQSSQNRIRSMALIHEQLYRSENLMDVNFSKYIENLVMHLYSSFHFDPDKVVFEQNIKDVELTINSAIPCGLIANELISNCLKHAFPENQGKFSVSMSGDDRNYTLLIEDDGIGFSENFDLENPANLGLQLVGILVDQMHGKLDISGEKGTSIKITFKTPENKAKLISKT